MYWILVLATPDPKVANAKIQYKSCDPELLIQDHISKISTNQKVCYTAKKDKSLVSLVFVWNVYVFWSGILMDHEEMEIVLLKFSVSRLGKKFYGSLDM